ncbi:MAG TPA: histidine phosphatase family protein [Clostridiales bacterium]|nr:histidine phosphatase family protein [Clostridiales bacterium]
MKSLKVHLLRHGLTDGNKNGQYIGVTDLPLNKEGIEELNWLKINAVYPDVRIGFVSPLLRCRQSMEILYPDINPIVVDNLREYNFGRFEGKTAHELEKDADFIKWTSGKADSPPGGEPGRDFKIRTCLALNQVVNHLLSSGENEGVVITHGGVIASILSACAVPRKPIFRWLCQNGRGYTVRILPSLYQRSGLIEVIEEIPFGG